MAKQKVTKLHNKLVRDNIPDHLASEGIEFETEEVSDDVRFVRLLLDILVEEAQETSLTFEDEALLEELADVESTIDSILLSKGFTRAQLEEVKDKKEAKNGTFSKKIFLISTTESEEA